MWAKVRGYSWWPARVGDVMKDSKDRKYRVDFIGDNTHQTVQHDKVANFVDKYPEYSKTKKRDLLESIETARKSLGKAEAVILEKRMGKPSIEQTNKKGMIMGSGVPAASEGTGAVA